MSYANPLHTPINHTYQSCYSTLSGATAYSQPAASSLSFSSTRRRLPQPAYVPTSKWRTATGRAGVVQYPAISFDYKGFTGRGVPMRELSARSVPGICQMIGNPEDAVLVHTGLKRITFRIMWPGYTHVEWARSIEIAVNGPITRAHLSQKIAQNFSRFIEMARGQKPTSIDHYIGPEGIQFEHLILIALHNVFEDSWQADVAVDFR